MSRLMTILSMGLLLVSCATQQETPEIIATPEGLNRAIAEAKPGDVIIMKNGTWEDVEIQFEAEGTADAPITLKAETPGKVYLEGQSSLELSGEYLIVEGLYFRNGYTPSNAVIDFRIDEQRIANHSIVRNCVIEDYTQKNRSTSDYWVEFWGRHNSLEYCSLTGKANQGPTVRFFFQGNENIRTYHKIAHNYFGPRPRKGGPRAETMQIGDSGTSMTPTFVQVENNLFDRCNGEVEVISSKTNFNEFRNNIFLNCEGSLVMRHGNYCIIDGNYFIGDEDSQFNGGVRIINSGHWVTNNYFYRISGVEFRSPLAIMNGIPKSPLNRYNQVTDVVVAYNSWVDCRAPWQLGVGANMDQKDVLPRSEIRSARPVRTVIANNIIYNTAPDPTPVQSYDKVDGILFRNNYLSNADGPGVDYEGIESVDLYMNQESDWLYVPVINQSADLHATYSGFEFEKIATDIFGNTRSGNDFPGAILPRTQNPSVRVDAAKYGASWFKMESAAEPETHGYDPQVQSLQSLIDEIDPGDVIVLPPGEENIEESIQVNKRFTLRGADGASRSIFKYRGLAGSPLFQMQPRGELILQNLQIKGSTWQRAVETLATDMSPGYKLWLDTVEISGFGHVLLGHKGSFADTIAITNSRIFDCENGIVLAAEKDDKGDYNAEFLTISNSSFESVAQNVVNFYRGGYDESTIGGVLTVEGSTFTNCGKLDASNILLKTRGIINVDIRDNVFTNNPVDRVAILWGAKNNKQSGNSVTASGRFQVVDQLKLALMY